MPDDHFQSTFSCSCDTCTNGDISSVGSVDSHRLSLEGDQQVELDERQPQRLSERHESTSSRESSDESCESSDYRKLFLVTEQYNFEPLYLDRSTLTKGRLIMSTQ